MVCEFVTAFIFIVASVTFDPVPGDFVGLHSGKQSEPEILIFDRFFVRGLPSTFLPSDNPFFGNCVDQVFRVRIQFDFAGFFEEFECGDGGPEFHAIVGGHAEPCGDFFAVTAGCHHCAKAAGAGIALAAAVGMNDHTFHKAVSLELAVAA